MTMPDDKKTFVRSQKIYERLLLAYPKAHRQEYGPVMLQLFRDQCRDAWHENRYWGLAKLWLRVLPDLACTSILERLATLNERKSMTNKLANLFGFQSQPWIIFFRMLLVVFLLVFITSAVTTRLLPEYYASTARIEINPVTSKSVMQTLLSYDPYFIQTEFEKIQSEKVLVPVISKLDLNDAWGRRYNNNVPLKTDQSLKLLRERLSLSTERNTKLIGITVFSEDKNEAARIANEVVYSYASQINSAGSSATSAPKIQFVESARPGLAPVSPNKPLNLCIGVVAGILLGSIAGGIAAGLASLVARRTVPK